MESVSQPGEDVPLLPLYDMNLAHQEPFGVLLTPAHLITFHGITLTTGASRFSARVFHIQPVRPRLTSENVSASRKLTIRLH